MKIVDARNLPCPEPVLKTKQALEATSGETITVLVNTPEACQNVQRFARSQGCTVEILEKENEYILEISRTGIKEEQEKSFAPILMITSDQLGTGDETLGQLLLTTFINTLTEVKPRPAKMLFINRGVMLTTEGSRVLDTLHQLEKEGVQIFSCGTCLNHYQLKDKLKVGKITNMYDTVSSLLTAERIIRI